MWPDPRNCTGEEGGRVGGREWSLGPTTLISTPAPARIHRAAHPHQGQISDLKDHPCLSKTHTVFSRGRLVSVSFPTNSEGRLQEKLPLPLSPPPLPFHLSSSPLSPPFLIPFLFLQTIPFPWSTERLSPLPLLSDPSLLSLSRTDWLLFSCGLARPHHQAE